MEDLGFESQQVKRFISLKTSRLPLGPPGLLFIGYQGFFLCGKMARAGG
jgi:hypothetical protein